MIRRVLLPVFHVLYNITTAFAGHPIVIFDFLKEINV